MGMSRLMLLLAAGLAAGALCAQADFGDAPASYGLMEAEQVTGGLGVGYIVDLTNPVTPSWSGDSDDCVVGAPLWDSWSSSNSLTIHVTQPGHLIIWVDADDNGHWSTDERYNYFPGQEIGYPGSYTITGIVIRANQSFARNGVNKVAVRITLQDNIGGAPNFSPTGSFYFGEVEDWLIDVEPAKFVVSTETLRTAVEGKPFNFMLNARNGTPPYTWSMTGGALPAQMSLTQTGDQFALSGTPGPGSGTGAVNYAFNVQVSDALSRTAIRTLILRVLPPPYALPFTDSFSTATGWTLGNTWVRGPATAYTSNGQSWDGWPACEPAVDATPSSSDNMILADSPGASRPDMMPTPAWAVSPLFDCSGVASVELRYQRWLSASHWNYDRVRVQVTNDGATWVDVWNNNFPYGWNAVADFSWTPHSHDISSVAANQPRVQVRFGIGACNMPQYLQLYGQFERFTGWCIDDVIIREKPAAQVITAQNFNVATTSSYFDPTAQQTIALLYPQNLYSFSVSVSNASSHSVTLTGMEVGTRQYGPGGFYGTQGSWVNVGSWSLALPVVVAPGASQVLSGQLLAGFVPAILANKALDATIYLYGLESATGRPLQATATFRFGMNLSPQPGLHVYEVQVGGVEVFNGATPAGLRDFGNVIAGQSGNWLNIVQKNTGSNPVNLVQAVISGPDAASFQINQSGFQSPIVNQTGSMAWFSLRFAPATPGLKVATVSFVHDAANTATPFSFEIRGYGAANIPVLSITEAGSGAGIAYGSPAVGGRDFGQVDVSAGPSAPLTILIENRGTQLLVLGSPQISGSADFTLQSASMSGSLAPGAITQFEVTFDPSAIGLRQATVSLSHNDPNAGQPFTFDVAGFGIVNAPIMLVAEGSGAQVSPGAAPTGALAFGPLDVGSGALGPVSIVVRNLGWQDLVLGQPLLTGPNTQDFVLDTTGMSLTLGHQQSTIIRLSFDPVSKGPKFASLSFTHNDGAAPSPFVINMSGLGVDVAGVVFVTSALPQGQETLAYDFSIQASGGTGPYTFSLVSGAPPAGLQLGADGRLWGVPAVHGIFSFRVRVKDSLAGTEEKNFQLNVQPAPGALFDSPAQMGGGCTSGEGRGLALLVLGLLAMLVAALRHRRALQRRP